MNKIITIVSVAFLILGSFWAQGQVVKVEITNTDDNWTLLRDGEPYYIKGAGGHVQLDILQEIGGNSIRTWGIDDAQKILDDAEKRGISVMMGLWVQHERHGFDYNDEVAVKKQLDHFAKFISEFKDHPALLMWAVGNEVDLNYTNTNVWDAVQDIAKKCHELDPNHPTTTVTAGLDGKEVKLIMEKCPDIDIYSINTYGDISNIYKDLKGYGWNGPYMITEWGPNGHWEVPATDWGAAIEDSSTKKAEQYSDRYENHIEAHQDRCLGSYVFLWGQKQETTGTWYGIFSVDGKCSGVIDELNAFWNNEKRNSAPKIEKFEIADQKDKNIFLRGDSLIQLNYKALDLDDKKIKISIVVLPESTDKKSGGDKENAPTSINSLVKKKKSEYALMRTPKQVGAYRVFIYVYDKHGNFASQNIPFYVDKEVDPNNSDRLLALKKRKLVIPN